MMKNAYAKLALRIGIVALALIAVSRVNGDDKRVIAGEKAGILISDSRIGFAGETKEPKVDPLPPGAGGEDIAPTPDNPAGTSGTVTPDITGTQVALVDTQPGGDITDIPGTETAGDAGIPGEDNPDMTGTDTAEDGTDIMGTGEAGDITQNPDAEPETDGDEAGSEVRPTPELPPNKQGVPENTDPVIINVYATSYMQAPENIRSLLVTSDEFYNPSIVAEAGAIPLDDNDARYSFITGKGYKAYTVGNMPKGFKSEAEAARSMVTFDVPVWKMDSHGKYASTWKITIHKKLAASVKCIFSDIFMLDIQFPFNYLKGFMYRKVGGVGLMSSKLMSAHSFGVAIDINYWDDDNDYFLGKGNDLRNKDNPYCIPDEVIEIFANYGWNWGGNFEICADTMHFQYFGLEFLQYDSDEPFPILYRGAEDMDSTHIRNLTQRLVKLGYLEKATASFSKKVDAAVKAFQLDTGLEEDGIVDYETWVPLINATHDMSYSF